MGLSKRDYQLLAVGWNAAVDSMRYEDGSPVEIVTIVNPYEQLLKEGEKAAKTPE